MAPAERLLIVDDNEMNRDMLSRRLRRQLYSVSVASSGEAALALVEAHPVDLVLLDIAMAGLSGLDVLTRLRTHWSAVELPVIMVTARSDSSGVVEALTRGANDYVTKPIDFAVMLARIRTHLHLHRSDAALRESEERYALAVRGANDGLWDWKLTTGAIYYSPRWKEMLGYLDAEIGAGIDGWYSRVHADDLDRLTSAIGQHLAGASPHLECEYRMLHRDGTYRWVSSRGLAVRDAGGTAVRLAGSQTDITEGKVADSLTGLPNRILLLDRIERLIERARRRPEDRFAVLFVDLDRFKVVNDSLGHAAGDHLLVAFARRIGRHLRAGDSVARLDAGGHTLARLGGDEFVIVLDDIRSVSDATRVAERIREDLTTPFELAGQDVVISASIGIAVSETGYQSAEDMLGDADMAMYRAKAHGKARHEVFEGALRTRAIHRLQIEGELRRAVDRQELVVFYQPIVSLATGRLVSFEALLRWPRNGRLALPAEFLDIAEENGLIVPISDFVLRQACRALQAWLRARAFGPQLTIAVNLSPRMLQHPGLVERIHAGLVETGLQPDHLHIEITETAIIDNSEGVDRVLRDLAASGVRLGLDDFGTGYSSLTYLHRFPIRTLKVDRSFVGTMDQHPGSEAIVRSIVTLARSLSMDTIAEGLETPEQMRLLKSFGCEYAQGLLFSPPLDREQADEYAASPSPLPATPGFSPAGIESP